MGIEKIKFDELGLVQTIIQDYYSKQVLMCAYMNKESLKKTMETGETWFYSRSRQKLWRKGETSGNTQKVVSIKIDCDGDALLIEVIKKGPACHLGTESCFDEKVYEDEKIKDFSFRELFNLIKTRKNTKKEGSYTTYLFEKGIDKILKKIGEESAEVIIAAKSLSKEETIYEISDLTYHLFVLMVEMGIEESDIFDMLASRYLK